MKISELLDAAMGDIKFSHEHSEKISGILAKVRDLRKDLAVAQSELSHAVDRMYAQLAMTTRKLQPELGVSLQKNGCVIGYRSRCLVCSADPHTGKWSWGDGDFGRIFQKKYGDCPIDSSLDDIAKNIVDFFGSHYKSLAITV